MVIDFVKIGNIDNISPIIIIFMFFYSLAICVLFFTPFARFCSLFH